MAQRKNAFQVSWMRERKREDEGLGLLGRE